MAVLSHLAKIGTSDPVEARPSLKQLADEFSFEKIGRAPDDLKIMPATTFVLGDTDADAHEKAHVIRRQQVSGQTAIKRARYMGLLPYTSATL